MQSGVLWTEVVQLSIGSRQAATSAVVRDNQDHDGAHDREKL